MIEKLIKKINKYLPNEFTIIIKPKEKELGFLKTFIQEDCQKFILLKFNNKRENMLIQDKKDYLLMNHECCTIAYLKVINLFNEIKNVLKIKEV